jgi:citrate synthase
LNQPRPIWEGDIVVDEMPRLTSRQAAARLNIKLETLYAYVARGLLVSERAEVGGSTFDPLDIEAFGESRNRRLKPNGTTGGMSGRPIMVLDSDLALIENDELFFRGRLATELARRLTFEEAVNFLWMTPALRDDLDEGFTSRREVVSSVRRATKALGPSARLIDQLSLAVIIAGSWDPVRESIGPAAVRDAGRQMIATMVDALPDLRGVPNATASLAARLWPKLSSAPASEENLRLLNATLVLSMEHDLAISTMAARVAASARAHPYSAIAAALSSFDSTIHGAASISASEMVHETLRTGNAERALANQVTKTGIIPGFGHVIYQYEDPRARFLLDAMRHMTDFREAMSVADKLSAVVARRSSRPINLDLALAVLVVGAGMRRDAGELIFAVSRTAGWIAHTIDEYSRPGLRLRPESRYTGPHPTPRS